MTREEALAQRATMIAEVRDEVAKIETDTALLGALEYLSDPENRDGVVLFNNVSATVMTCYATDRKRWKPVFDRWLQILKWTAKTREALSG